jgi:hypothetical protein
LNEFVSVKNDEFFIGVLALLKLYIELFGVKIIIDSLFGSDLPFVEDDIWI